MIRPQTVKTTAVLIGLLLAVSGCAWVKVDPGAAEKVGVATSASIVGCEKIGSTRSRTRNQIGFITRDRKKVAGELEVLARNEAPGLGGNVVAATGPIEVIGRDAVQRFDVFACASK